MQFKNIRYMVLVSMFITGALSAMQPQAARKARVNIIYNESENLVIVLQETKSQTVGNQISAHGTLPWNLDITAQNPIAVNVEVQSGRFPGAREMIAYQIYVENGEIVVKNFGTGLTNRFPFSKTINIVIDANNTIRIIPRPLLPL